MSVIRISTGVRLSIIVFTTVLLCACYNELDWREFSSATGRYRVTLPSKSHEETRTLTGTTGAVTMTMNTAKAADWVFAVAYADYPGSADLRSNVTEQRDALLRNTSGRIVRQSISTDGVLTLVAEGRKGETIIELHARFIIDGKRLYQIAAVGSKGAVPETELDTFLDSFKLQH